MAAHVFDPFRLDVEVFAKEAATLEGCWPLLTFERLADTAPPERLPADADGVTWKARGERRLSPNGETHVWLHLEARSRLALVCQRCLEPVDVPAEIERSILFVSGEAAAARIDAERDDDVLALSRALDLHELIEDELLLGLPLVPRHDLCPEPLPVPTDDTGDEEREASPFAALAALKRTGPVN